jgi:predicted DNA-binding transcriptional regulator YafY
VVRFRACGLWEMAWHLFTWGDGVRVLEPAALRESYRRMIEAALRSVSEETGPKRVRRARAARSASR